MSSEKRDEICLPFVTVRHAANAMFIPINVNTGAAILTKG